LSILEQGLTCVILSQGAICLDTLGSGWSPVQTVKTALLSLRMLLEFPNPSDPQDAEVAKMMLERPEDFTQKAHEWAIYHAGAPRNPKLDLQRYKKEKEADSQVSEDAKYVYTAPTLRTWADAMKIPGIPPRPCRSLHEYGLSRRGRRRCV
jgi:ubiquitin-conjugating enzyme